MRGLRAGFILILLGVMLVGAYLLWPAHTRSLRYPGIAILETVQLGGVDQWILIRGHDRANPVVVFLHGGPGMPLMFLAHGFQDELEEDFVVVQWDRRGAGKSYMPEVPDLSVERLIADAWELLDILEDRLGAGRVVLVGHSFGSYLGAIMAQRRPERFVAFVGVGQVVDRRAEAHLQEEFLRAEATRRGDARGLAALDSEGNAAFEALLFRYGAELASARSWTPLLIAGLASPEYTIRDVLNVPRGSSRASRDMRYDEFDGTLLGNLERLEVPAYFFTGRRDWTSPFPLIERFVERLDAPHKEIVWFERSAHFPFYEEPSAFAEQLRRVVCRQTAPATPTAC